MQTLLEETLEALAELHRDGSAVEWIGSRDGAFACPWSTFTERARRAYRATGSQVARDLVVVAHGGVWLERGPGGRWKACRPRPREGLSFSSVFDESMAKSANAEPHRKRQGGPNTLTNETLAALERFELRSEAVRWVGSADGRYAQPWDHFAAVADSEYMNNTPRVQKHTAIVEEDLVIVGDDWFFERRVDDGGFRLGAQGWVLRTAPIRATTARPFHRLFDPHGRALHEINGEDGQ